MTRFIIRAEMQDGSAWETIRHTKDGLDNEISSILKDDRVVKFTVTEEKI